MTRASLKETGSDPLSGVGDHRGVAVPRRPRSGVWRENLACTERDDAAHRIVGRHANGHSITGNYFNAKAAHPAAQLGKHLVPGVTLHAV